MKIPEVCPFCGHKVVKTSNAAVYGRAYGNGMCFKCTFCDAYVGCHSNGEPLGTLANKPTRDLRQKCHNMFDILWKVAKINRGLCYKELANRLEIPVEQCHFAMFDIPMLNKALEVIPQLKKDLLKNK